MSAWKLTNRPGRQLWFFALVLLAWGCGSGQKPAPTAPAPGNAPAAAASSSITLNDKLVTSVPFNERHGKEEYNASGVVPLADGRFLFCDNNVGHALFELSLDAQGQEQSPIISRPLLGLGVDAPDDLEGMTYADEGGRRFIFATSSLYLKKARKHKPDELTPSGLLRITPQADGSLRAENLPGFRAWFLQQVPELAAAAELEPDDGGLNVEGLAWDAQRRALLFGVRTPAPGGQPLVVPVQVKDLAGAWTTGNLTALTPIRLALPTANGELGIRSLEYIPERQAFLVIAGKSTSDFETPFTVFEWDGKTPNGLKRLPLSFARKTKPEGVTSGTVGGKPVLIFVDDSGGFSVQPLVQS